ncbi:MAG: ATPase, partial [Gemmatimonadota bacterium]|nr:ATPase [Gemmatimonadota bacterium]
QALRRIRALAEGGAQQVSQVLATMDDELTAAGLDFLDSGGTEILATVRVQEVAGALNRLRSLRMLEPDS